jgi:hypothetical protein
MIYPNCHPTYNERHEKIIELINWTLEKYRGRIKETHKELVIIDDIIKELDKKRDIARYKKKQAQAKDEFSFLITSITTLYTDLNRQKKEMKLLVV